MNQASTLASAATAVLVVASLAMLVPMSALGACQTTLRGELVRSDGDQASPPMFQAAPQKFLFFSLRDTIADNRIDVEKQFQSFTVSNSKTTFPIPFALNIVSDRDCPTELELSVLGWNAEFPDRWFATWDLPLRGVKRIRLDRFEAVPVWGPTF